MSKFPSFLEYLNDKGSVVEKPAVETVPDYHGREENSPPNSKVPYKTPMANKAPAKGESGLGDLGNNALKYEPDTKVNYEVKKDVMKEYVNEKGKVVEKAKVDIKADYKGPHKDAPEGKGAKPYIAKNEKVKAEKGLAGLGSKELEYNPNTEVAKKPTKTEGFLSKTKGMSISEFTKYMLEECGCGQVSGEDLPYVTAYTTGKFQPHPPEVIRYVSALADKNQGILENLVGQMISMGHLNKLLRAIFEHPQAYEELTNLFSDDDGPSRCNSFVGAMNNSYSKFLSDQDGLYESVSSPMGFDMEDLEGEEEENEDDSEEEPEEDYSDEDSEDESEESDSDEDSEDFDDEDLDSDEDTSEEEPEEDAEDHMDSNMETPAPERRLKKKFAHDHLLGAMKNHEQMFKAMRGI